MQTLKGRVNRLEDRIDPKGRIRFCFWTEEADGSDLRRMYPNRCAAGLEEPTGEDCQGCDARKIIFTLIATDEDIEIADARRRGTRSSGGAHHDHL